MLRVRSKLGQSAIHGIGVFADEFIAKNQVIFYCDRYFDKIIPVNDLVILPKVTQEHIKQYAFLDNGLYYLCCDNAKFINHSDNPNVIATFEMEVALAARDIQIGEELTENYYSFDEAAAEKLKQE